MLDQCWGLLCDFLGRNKATDTDVEASEGKTLYGLVKLKKRHAFLTFLTSFLNTFPWNFSFYRPLFPGFCSCLPPLATLDSHSVTHTHFSTGIFWILRLCLLYPHTYTLRSFILSVSPCKLLVTMVTLQ